MTVNGFLARLSALALLLSLPPTANPSERVSGGRPLKVSTSQDVFSTTTEDSFRVVSKVPVGGGRCDLKLRNPRTGYTHSHTVECDRFDSVGEGDTVSDTHDGRGGFSIRLGRRPPRPPRSRESEPEVAPAEPAPQPPRPRRPPPVLCTLQQLAALVFERYETGRPIGIVKVANSPNTYLLLLSGTEADWEQATFLPEDVREAFNISNRYRDAILNALRRARLPAGAKIIVAGHSLGGMAGQNVVASEQFGGGPEVNGLQLRAERVITFGSPNTPARINTSYVHVEAEGDPVPRIINPVRLVGTVVRIPGRGPHDPVGNHMVYAESEALKLYDAIGQEDGSVCLRLDLSSFQSYAAPRLRSQENDLSELIGERRMQAHATGELGYESLLSPGEASKHRQGYDGIYWDPARGAIVIGEAKGGYNGKRLNEILGTGYGYRQGSIGWARKAAERITRSLTTNDKEVRYAELILCALGAYDNRPRGRDGRDFCEGLQGRRPGVRVEVFHTEIYDGVPGETKHYVTARYP